MTEHRPLYHAFSGVTESISPSPLIQHYTDGTVSRDIIFLLPILESGYHRDLPSPCLQLIHLPNGDLSFCNHRTEHRCACCGNAVCEQHHHTGFLSFQDETGAWQVLTHPVLCEGCAHLDSPARYAIYTFRHVLNAEGEAGSHA